MAKLTKTHKMWLGGAVLVVIGIIGFDLWKDKQKGANFAGQPYVFQGINYFQATGGKKKHSFAKQPYPMMRAEGNSIPAAPASNSPYSNMSCDEITGLIKRLQTEAEMSEWNNHNMDYAMNLEHIKNQIAEALGALQQKQCAQPAHV